jgi:predicted nucleic acid-binding Zn ribbon protein
MPIFEFFCPVCDERKELNQKYTDPPPKCAHNKNFTNIAETDMKIKISKSSFQLKGNRWFKNGY